MSLLREVVVEHRGRLFRRALRLTADPWLAEDLVQDVALHACAPTSRYAGTTVTDARRYLYGVLRRVWIELLRHEARRWSASHAQSWYDSLNPAGVDVELRSAAIERAELLSAVAQLSRTQRDAVRLSLEGYGPHEIVKRLRLPAGTVTAAMSRARRTLLRIFDPSAKYPARTWEPMPLRVRLAEIVRLRARGFKYREIAESLGLQIGSIGPSLTQARTMALTGK